MCWWRSQAFSLLELAEALYGDAPPSEVRRAAPGRAFGNSLAPSSHGAPSRGGAVEHRAQLSPPAEAMRVERNTRRPRYATVKRCG